MIRFAAAAALAFAFASAAVAQDVAADARDFVQTLADRVGEAAVKIAEDPDADISADFQSILDDGFDVPVIAQFVIGRNWRRAEDAERDRFLALFNRMVVQTYATQIASFGGRDVAVTETRIDNPKIAVVTTEIDRGDAEPFRLGWRVRTTDEMKIIDVIVEGVSLAQTQRSEYASVMRNSGGLKGLNDKLEEQLAKAEADAEAERDAENVAKTESPAG